MHAMHYWQTGLCAPSLNRIHMYGIAISRSRSKSFLAFITHNSLINSHFDPLNQVYP